MTSVRQQGSDRRSRVALGAIFFANGAGLASWLPHIPSVQSRLDLGTGPLGVALLGMAAGALLAIPLAGASSARFGSANVVRASAAIFFAGLALPVLATDFSSLLASLVLLGAGNGALDVSMNAQAAALERRRQQPIMASLHGLWSVGGLAGAAAAALALHLDVAPATHLLGSAVGLGTLAYASLHALLPRESEANACRPAVTRPTGVLATLGFMALLALVSEGAIGDWSALYLRQTLGTSAATAALGFAAFQLTMATGRFTGDAIVARLGGARVLGLSGAVAAVGLGVALVVGDPMVTVLGCALVGAGLSNVIPILFRAAAEIPGVAPGHGIAAVSTAGYCGFLAGPPLIGLTAEVLTLPGALGIVVFCLAWIGGAARRIGPPLARART